MISLLVLAANLPAVAAGTPPVTVDVMDGIRRVASFASKSGDSPVVASHVSSEDCTPLFLGYPHGPKTAEFVPPGLKKETVTYSISSKGSLNATLYASQEAFACEDRPNALLGSSFGRASSGRFNAVYDRKSDTLLTVEGEQLRLEPIKEGFALTVHGPAKLLLKRDYVKRHLGYFLWNANSKLWKQPVAGWCSWMAYLQGVREQDVREVAHFFSSNLKEYGYNVIQIDDGFQRTPQSGDVPLAPGDRFADFWSKPNDKFPSGLGNLAHDISAQGLTPGIWVGLYLPLGIKNADGYVTDANGKPHRGPWVNYAVNGLNSAARNEAYVDSIRDLKKQGWQYFKIDTLRHVLYDNYRQTPAYWAARHESAEEAYRAILQGIRKVIGPNDYLLACWGTIPELAGIPDGCRIGEDVGPDVASMRRSAKYIAQFNYLNNVVWRNDPDYMCLRVPIPQAQTWATLTSLAGGHVMVSDPVKDYDSARVEILRKVGPPLITHPQNVSAVAPDPEWLTLQASKGGENWLVAARFAWEDQPARTMPLEELGLDPHKKYLAFDFWKSKFEGVVERSVNCEALANGECQVLSLRPLVGHPQVLGTDRHIGQGAYELEDVRWKDNQLSGRMKRGMGARWSLYIHVPDGWVLKSKPKDADVRSVGQVIKVTFKESAGEADWSLGFHKVQR